MSKILITGATGKLGTHVIHHLLKQTTADQIVALARDDSKVGEHLYAGVEIRYGNYDDPDSLHAAISGIDRVLFVSGTDPLNRLNQHQNVIDAARDNSVEFIAYAGVSMKDVNTSELKFLMNSHFATETYLKESGLRYAIFRNTLYADDLPYYAGKKETWQKNGIVICAEQGKVPFSLKEEMAEAIAGLLAQPADRDKTYEIVNSRAFSFGEIAAKLTRLTGVPVPYAGNNPERFDEVIKEMGLPGHVSKFLTLTAEDIQNGQYDISNGDLEHLLGREPVGLTAILRKVYGL